MCQNDWLGFDAWRLNKSWVSQARLLIISSVVQGTTSLTQPELLSLVWSSNQICGWDRRQTGHSYHGAPRYERNFKQVERNSFSWKHHSLFFFSAYTFIILSEWLWIPKPGPRGNDCLSEINFISDLSLECFTFSALCFKMKWQMLFFWVWAPSCIPSFQSTRKLGLRWWAEVVCKCHSPFNGCGLPVHVLTS